MTVIGHPRQPTLFLIAVQQSPTPLLLQITMFIWLLRSVMITKLVQLIYLQAETCPSTHTSSAVSSGLMGVPLTYTHLPIENPTAGVVLEYLCCAWFYGPPSAERNLRRCSSGDVT